MGDQGGEAGGSGDQRMPMLAEKDTQDTRMKRRERAAGFLVKTEKTVQGVAI